MKIYGDIRSGNCYKLKLAASLLELEHTWIHVDILNGETRTPAFLSMNPNGKIPVIELHPGQYLAESNAILWHLGHGSRLVPADGFLQAKTLEWMFFEQYSHEPYIAVARFIASYLGLPDERRAEYEAKQVGGHNALGVMERRLAMTPFLVGETLTIADVALYAYTHVADEGGFDLTHYPAIQEWLRRIAAEPGHVSMADAIAATASLAVGLVSRSRRPAE
jgi:glutathione S-transferase